MFSLVLTYFDSFNLAYNKNKLYKTLEYWSEDMLNFDFSGKGLVIASPLHFVCDVSRKIFHMLYSINWPNFIVWLSVHLEILGNMFIAIVCFSACDVINFETTLIFQIKPFFFMAKNLRQNFEYLENEKRF